MARCWNSLPVISTLPDPPTACLPSPRAPPSPAPAPPVWTTTRTWWPPTGKRSRTTSKLPSWSALNPPPATPRDKQDISRKLWSQVRVRGEWWPSNHWLQDSREAADRRNRREMLEMPICEDGTEKQDQPHCSLASAQHSTGQACLLSASGSVFSKSWFSFIILQLYDILTVRFRFISLPFTTYYRIFELYIKYYII